MELDTIEYWIEASFQSIAKHEVEVIKHMNTTELAYKLGEALKNHLIKGGLLTGTFGALGKSVLLGHKESDDVRDRNVKRVKIGHHLFMLLVENDIINFTTNKEKTLSFKEGKWGCFKSKAGNYVLKPNVKANRSAYDIEVLDEPFIEALVNSIDETIDEVGAYTTPQFEMPDGFEGSTHPIAGELVRFATRRQQRYFDKHGDCKAIRVINKQIQTPYEINVELLEVLQKLQRSPLFSLSKENLTQKQRRSKSMEMRSIMTMANTIGYRYFYTYKFYDRRGRMYNSCNFLKHDGNKLAKSLIQLHEKQEVGQEGLFWMKFHATNCWGEDKLSIDDRYDYAQDRLEEWLEYGRSPLKNKGWMEADSPFEFLQVCMELSNAYKLQDPSKYESGMLIGIDASCSGLQILSALSKDEVSGKLCNLTGTERGDYYNVIAQSVWKRYTYSKTDEQVYRRVKKKLKGVYDFFTYNQLVNEIGAEDMDTAGRVFWGRLAEKQRAICKRGCMTYFYSCKAETMANAILKDQAHKPEFAGINPTFCFMLATDIYNACRTEMRRPSALMDLFIEIGMRDYKNGDQLSLLDEDGEFMFDQSYTKIVTKNYTFKKCVGETMTLKVIVDNGALNHHKVRSASSPNVVHHLDSMIVRGLINLTDYQISCIHDCFATIPANVGKLYEDVRSVFINMFKDDLLMKILKQKGYEDLYDKVEFGSLELTDVEEQEFFAS